MLKNSLFLLVITFASASFGGDFKDLGTHGNTYEIKEEDAMSVIQHELKKIPPKKIIEEASKESTKIYFANMQISNCKQTIDREFNPTVTLEHPIDLSNYGIYVPKGEAFNPLDKGLVSSYVFFADATNPLHVALAEKISRQSGGNMLIIVSNGDIRTFQHLTSQVYKLDENTKQAFDLKCVPSIYSQQQNIFLVREFFIKNEIDEAK